MKHFFTISLALLCAATAANAQLRVNSNGNMALKTSLSPLSGLSIGSAGNASYDLYAFGNNCGIYSMAHNKEINSNWANAGYFKAPHSGSSFYVGLQGLAISSTGADRYSGRAFGVLGRAGNATSGYNYGVFGRIDGNNYGAAIYGTTDRSENGTPLTRRYAGYFNGTTGVNGDLYVSGNIHGVLIGDGVGTMSAARTFSSNEAQETAHDKLAGFTAMKYYKPSAANKAMAVESDTATTKQPMNAIAAQSLAKMHYALSAEQLEAVYPDLVYEMDNGTKGINYMELIPILVQAIGELNAKIEALEAADGKLQTRANAKAASGSEPANKLYAAKLAQNEPNPFANATKIELTIPTDAQNALLCIYDMSGKQIQQMPIADRGNTYIEMNSAGLSAGMYLYSLIIDGQLIDTKRMVVTK